MIRKVRTIRRMMQPPLLMWYGLHTRALREGGFVSSIGEFMVTCLTSRIVVLPFVFYILLLLIFIPPRSKTIASCEARPPRTAQAAADSSTPRLETRSASQLWVK